MTTFSSESQHLTGTYRRFDTYWSANAVSLVMLPHRRCRSRCHADQLMQLYRDPYQEPRKAPGGRNNFRPWQGAGPYRGQAELKILQSRAPTGKEGSRPADIGARHGMHKRQANQDVQKISKAEYTWMPRTVSLLSDPHMSSATTLMEIWVLTRWIFIRRRSQRRPEAHSPFTQLGSYRPMKH